MQVPYSALKCATTAAYLLGCYRWISCIIHGPL